ncbi:hypothetical protein DNTS_007749 [Danionella cerebrum]|uniref:Transmembrane protein 198 n=1 Tax=Danionella cerebrum TaxID=2873325 RepID=A0A553R847_9TELE|nr:hypothetical protein DNTS_007749 [Danionella translucida]
MTSTLQSLAFKLAPPAREAGAGLGDPCEDGGPRRYEVVPSVVCSMCSVLFLTGLMFGSIIIFLLCYKERVLDTQLSVEASVGIGLGIGTLCGLVTMLVRSVGLFMVGLLLGLLVGIGTLIGMEEFSSNPPRSVWVPLGVLLGLGMLFAVLTLQWQRCFTTLSTAVFGAAVIVVATDYFVELFALVRYIYERVKTGPREPVCWVTWMVLGAWPALALLGVLVQWRICFICSLGTITSAITHCIECKPLFCLSFWPSVMISRQQRRVQLMRIRQKDERRESSRKKKRKQPPNPQNTHAAKAMHAEPAYRRKPNPIRRFDGDVLSPSYIQSFRDRQVDDRAYAVGGLMSSGHTSVNIDYDCGSTVPLTAGPGPQVRV